MVDLLDYLPPSRRGVPGNVGKPGFHRQNI